MYARPWPTGQAWTTRARQRTGGHVGDEDTLQDGPRLEPLRQGQALMLVAGALSNPENRWWQDHVGEHEAFGHSRRPFEQAKPGKSRQCVCRAINLPSARSIGGCVGEWTSPARTTRPRARCTRKVHYMLTSSEAVVDQRQQLCEEQRHQQMYRYHDAPCRRAWLSSHTDLGRCVMPGVFKSVS